MIRGLSHLQKNSITSNVMSKKVYMLKDKRSVPLTKNSIMSNVTSKKERSAKTCWSIGPSRSLGQRLKRGGERRGNNKGLVPLTKSSITSNVMSKKIYMPRDKKSISLIENSITSNLMSKKVSCIEWAMGCVCIYIFPKYNSIKRKRIEGQRHLRGERRGNKNSITSNVMSKKV